MFSDSVFHLITIVVIFCVQFNSIESTSHDKSLASLSYLNTFELDNDFKYQIEIDKNVKLASSYRQEANVQPNFITIKSVYGQTYECYLPNSDEYYETVDSSDHETSNLNKNQESSNSKFNFTLVDEKIEKYVKNLKTTMNCIYKVNVFFYLIVIFVLFESGYF